MPIETDGALARLSGHILIEEAEPLAEWLRATPDPLLDLAECTALHSAVLQVMLAGGVRLSAAPPDAWLAALLPTPIAEVPQ
jgi:hypothetical protein